MHESDQAQRLANRERRVRILLDVRGWERGAADVRLSRIGRSDTREFAPASSKTYACGSCGGKGCSRCQRGLVAIDVHDPYRDVRELRHSESPMARKARVRESRADGGLWDLDRIREQQKRASRSWPKFKQLLSTMRETQPQLYEQLDLIALGDVDVQLPPRPHLAVRWLTLNFKGRIHLAPWLLDQYSRKDNIAA